MKELEYQFQPGLDSFPDSASFWPVLKAAVGYFELGLYEDALEEIEELAPDERVTPDALQLRAAIYMQLQKWSHLHGVATALVNFRPENAQHWIWLAYATRRCIDIGAAEGVLRRAVAIHPGEAIIHFNLACYCAQSGELDAARSFLKEAIRIDPGTRQMAVDDPDLEPLW